MGRNYQGYSVKEIQRALNKHGYKLKVDGVMGSKTETAISDFKHKQGWMARPWIGPLTAEALELTAVGKKVKRGDGVVPPWVTIMNKWMYTEEVKHNAELRKFLKSDGRALGDPAKLPWCGDWMETCVKLSLPDEPFPGKLGENPYWALNWQYLGGKSKLRYGAMLVIKRPKGGHIAVAVGYDPKRKRIRMRGGNQSNMVKDSWIDEQRVRHIRKPKTWKTKLTPIPIMNSKGAVLSRNEA